MALEVKGISALVTEIHRVAAETSRAELDLVREFGKKIADRAKMYAPVDEGDLEKSIKAEEPREGVNGRIVMRLGIDYSELGSSWSERGFNYALAMHEDILGNSGKGPLSREKSRALGVWVGPKYLSRALEDYREPMQEAWRAMVRGITRS